MSNLRPFGQWITTLNWSEVSEIADCNSKYEKFHEIISLMINRFFPVQKTKVSRSDKPWMTSSLKSSIAKRQNALHRNGKNSNFIGFGVIKSSLM